MKDLYDGGVSGVRVILASTSPRRRQLLAEAGVAFDVLDPRVEDGELLRARGTSVAQWVCALSYLKALGGARELARSEPGGGAAVVIGADTLVELDGRVVTKPTGPEDARLMLRSMLGRWHEVLTGVSLVEVPAAGAQGERGPGRRGPDGQGRDGQGRGGVVGRRELFTDRARVWVGDLSEAQVQQHISSGAWAGKAGGYNFAEQVALGWPLRVEGDATGVMGLPLGRLLPRLRRFVALCADVAGAERASDAGPATGAERAFDAERAIRGGERA